jgi:CRISPR-associated protein Csm5
MRYKLTVLTPLLVGDGQKLAPIDYMVWKDQINVLDQTRIFRLLSKGPRLEGYLTQLRKVDKLDFASWGGFAQNYSERRIPFEHASSTPVFNHARPEHLFIPTFAAGPHGAYLPASALKGALRTAVAFTRWNEGVIREVGARAEGDRPPRRPGEAAEAMTLGGPQGDAMRSIMAADSDPVPSSTFRVYLVRVAALESRGPKLELGWKLASRGYAPANRPEQWVPVFA